MIFEAAVGTTLGIRGSGTDGTDGTLITESRVGLGKGTAVEGAVLRMGGATHGTDTIRLQTTQPTTPKVPKVVINNTMPSHLPYRLPPGILFSYIVTAPDLKIAPKLAFKYLKLAET